MKHLLLIPALILLESPAFASMSTWADPYGRSFTPASTWNTTASQGVFGGIAHRMAETGGGSAPVVEQPEPRSAGPAMALSITPGGLLDFVFQQLYSSFSGEEAERLRTVLAPQYEAMAQHLQSAFGGADTVAFPEGAPAPAPAPDNSPAPAAATKVTLSAPATAPAPAPAPDEPLSVTQSMAVVAATSLLVNPTATLPGASANSLLLAGAGFSGTPLETTAVPEPSTVLLVGAGLGWAMARRRRIR